MMLTAKVGAQGDTNFSKLVEQGDTNFSKLGGQGDTKISLKILRGTRKISRSLQENFPSWALHLHAPKSIGFFIDPYQNYIPNLE